MANQDLMFDITKQSVEQEKQQYIISRVGDGGLKAVTVKVLSNGTPYNLTGLTPVFEGVKSDDTRIIDTQGATVLDAVNGVFRYIFPRQASTAEGEYQQAFFKLKRGEQTDSTMEIRVNVLKNKVEFGINSESYFTEYQQMIENLQAEMTKALKALETTADATKIKVKGNESLADTLRTQLKGLERSINGQHLVTQDTLREQIEGVTGSIRSLTESLATARQELQTNIDHLGRNSVSTIVSNTPIADIADITETGYYFYDKNVTQNLPTLNSSNASGYIHAVMRDRQNGMIELLGTGYMRERYRGQLYGRWVTTLPVLLWSGTGKSGNTLQLNGSARQFKYLVFDLSFYTNHYATVKIRIPEGTANFYLDAFGAKTNSNVANSTLEEIELALKDDTHLQIKSAMSSSNGAAQTASNEMTIYKVYGVE
ncbi:phage baseplate upper protein [Staphylococcus pseudintermedius]|nr:phage baseplate upper protein [Staphylococcus pseudintermedius]